MKLKVLTVTPRKNGIIYIRDIYTWWTGEIGMDVNHYMEDVMMIMDTTKQSHIQMTE